MQLARGAAAAGAGGARTTGIRTGQGQTRDTPLTPSRDLARLTLRGRESWAPGTDEMPPSGTGPRTLGSPLEAGLGPMVTASRLLRKDHFGLGAQPTDTEGRLFPHHEGAPWSPCKARLRGAPRIPQLC